MKNMPTEAEEQESLVYWLRLKKLLHFSPNNENQHSFTNRKVAMIQEQKAKRMGKLKGVSDIVVFLEDKILFIELKRRKKKLKNGKMSVSHTKVSKEQGEFIERANKYQYCSAIVAYGWKEAVEFIESQMPPKK